MSNRPVNFGEPGSIDERGNIINLKKMIDEARSASEAGDLTRQPVGNYITSLTGDVTAAGPGSVPATIAAGAVTYAKIQNVSGADKVLGRASAGAGVVEEISCTAAGRALLDDATANDQRNTLGLGTADSPIFATVKLSGLTDGYIPYHSSDAIGLANSPIFTNGNVGIGTITPGGFTDILAPAVLGAYEIITKWSMADAPTSYINVMNYSAGAGVFLPAIECMNAGDNRQALQFAGLVADAAYGAKLLPAMQFSGSIRAWGNLTTVPIVSFSNTSNHKLVTWYDGRTKIGGTDGSSTGCVRPTTMLDVIGNGSTDNLLNLLDGTTSRMYVTRAGWVGLGIVTPTSKFHIYDEISAYNSQMTIHVVSDSRQPTVNFMRSRASGANCAAGDPIGRFQFNAQYAGVMNDVVQFGGTYVGDGTTRSGDLWFQTANNGAPVERMRILYNGNIGIGTAAPQYPLHIFGTCDGSAAGPLVINATGSIGCALSLRANDVGGYMYSFISTGPGASGGAGDFAVYCASGGYVFRTNYMGQYIAGLNYYTYLGQITCVPWATDIKGIVVRGKSGQTANLQEWQNSAGDVLGAFSPGGNVGIGTVTPAAKLDVVGGIFAQTIRLTTGAVAGYLLSSDADGDASWIAPTIGLTDGDKGDITVSASGATWTIDNDAVTYAKMQNVSAADKLLGRVTAGAGDVEEIACTAAGRALLDDATASAQRTTLGLGTLYSDGTYTGVGTTSPLQKFCVVTSGADSKEQGIQLVVPESAIGSARFGLVTDNAGYNRQQAYIKFMKLNAATARSGAIAFFTAGTDSDACSEQMRINNLGNVGIGTPTPAARIHIKESTALGGTSGNYQILKKIQGFCTGNDFYNNLWLLRDADGADWQTVRLHDAISIDTVFATPKVDTKVWWERDPMHNIQSWGQGASTYLTINAGNVGIGTSAPSGKLHVYLGASLATPSGGANFILESNSTNVMQFLSPNTVVNGIMFGDPESPFAGYIRYSHVDNTMKFYTDAGVRATIDSAGNVGIGTTAPLSKLSINGGLHVGGDSDAGDNNVLIDGKMTSATIKITTGAAAGYALISDADGDGVWTLVPGVSTAWPIGSVFFGAVATNPATLLGFGTWTQIARGKFIIGEDGSTYTPALATGGASTINLAHVHYVGVSTTDVGSGHTHTFSATSGSASAAEQVQSGTGLSIAAYMHDHAVSGTTDSTGSGHTHGTSVSEDSKLSATQSIIPPYCVLYIWQRTA